jgi:hypothetical protein
LSKICERYSAASSPRRQLDKHHLPSIDADAAFGAQPDKRVASQQPDLRFALSCGFARCLRSELGCGHNQPALVHPQRAAQLADHRPDTECDHRLACDPTARGLRDVPPKVVVPAVSFLQFLLTAAPVMAVLADLKDLPLSKAPAGTATSTSTASGTTSLPSALVAVADMPSEKLT